MKCLCAVNHQFLVILITCMNSFSWTGLLIRSCTQLVAALFGIAGRSENNGGRLFGWFPLGQRLQHIQTTTVWQHHVE